MIPLRRKNVTLQLMLFSLVFILISTPLTNGQDPSSTPLESAEAPSRGIEGHTETVIEPGPGMFENMSGLSNEGTTAFTLESNTPLPFHTITASHLTGLDLNGARTVSTTGHHTFVAYIKKGAAWTSFWLSRYDSRSDYWDPPLEVHNVTGYSSSACELLIHQGRLYLLMSLISGTPSQSGLFMKHSSVENWIGLVDQDPTSLDIGGSVTRKTGMAGSGNSVVVFWKKDTSNELWEIMFTDGVWSNPVKVLSVVGTFALSVRDLGSTRHLMLFFTSGNGRSINLTVSTNNGVTWGGIVNVNRTAPGSFISHLSATEFQGMVNLLAVDRNNGKGYVFGSPNNINWKASQTVFDLSPGDPVDGNLEGQISSDRSQVAVSIEKGGKMQIYTSEDEGKTFSLLAEIGSDAHCPLMTEDKSVIGFFEGNSLNLLRFEKEMSGHLRTVLIRPVGLRSWNDIGLNVDGFDEGCGLNLRVLDGSDDSQLFPETGMEDMLSYPAGNIEGPTYSHALPLAGAWTGGASLVRGIKLEIQVERVIDSDPAILSIVINHSSSMIFSEEIADPEHISMLSNCSVTGSGVRLDDYSNRGEFVYGPVEKEDEWCDVLGIDVSSQSVKVSFRAELRDDNMRTIPGYSFGDSVEMRGLTGINYARWNTRYLKDLPGTVGRINIAFRIASEEPTARPTVETVHFDMSVGPLIEDAVLTDTGLMRGQSAEVILEVSDREDPVDLLGVKLQHRLKGTGPWLDHMSRGSMLVSGAWSLPFITSYTDPVGEYELKATVIDSMGDTAELILPSTFTLANNRPIPPLAYIIPDRPTTGSDLSVEIFKTGSDLETPEEDLAYSYRIYRNDVLYSELLNTKQKEYRLDEGIIREGEVWKASITTFDGIIESAPTMLSITVVNTLPFATDAPSNITFMEDTRTGVILYKDWFGDIDEETLQFETVVSEGITIETSGEGIVLGTEQDFNGEGTLQVTARDEEGREQVTVQLIVEPVNDPPVISPLRNITVMQGESVTCYVSAGDAADGEEVTVTSDITDKIPGISVGHNFMQFQNGSFILEATNEMVGRHIIQLRASDGTVQVNSSFTIEMINVNDPPGKPFIAILSAKTIFNEGDEIDLSANCTDPDLEWGDNIHCTWSSTISGEIGSGASIRIVPEAGIHIITLTVEDDDGLSNSTSITVEVLPLPVETSDTLETGTLLTYTALAAFIIGAILGLLLFFLVRSRRSKPQEEGEEPSGEKAEKEETAKDEPGEETAKEDPDKGGVSDE